MSNVKSEADVERIVRMYLKDQYLRKGWKMTTGTSKLKKPGQHGADIILYNQNHGRYMVIEIKKYSNSSPQNFNTFYSFFGQILSRIDTIKSLNYSKKKYFVLAAPTDFVKFAHKVIHNTKNYGKIGMIGGWKLFGAATNLRVWAIDMKKGNIEEYHWKDLLKRDLKHQK